MPLILDTGVLYAYYDAADRWHTAARELIEGEAGGLVLPAPVIPEIDYLLGKRLGGGAQLVFLEGLSTGSYLVVELPQEAFSRVLELCRRYEDLRLGFVDAAVMAIAENLGLGRIGTLDRRHFSAVTLELPLELLPA